MPRNYQQLAPLVQFENQLASSLYSVGFILPGSRSTVGFITRDFLSLISRQHSQTNQYGLYTLFLTSKSRCMQKISSVDALLTTQNALSRSGRFGGSHTGWSQLQLASSVSPLWQSDREKYLSFTVFNKDYQQILEIELRYSYQPLYCHIQLEQCWLPSLTGFFSEILLSLLRWQTEMILLTLSQCFIYSHSNKLTCKMDINYHNLFSLDCCTSNTNVKWIESHFVWN